MAEHDQDDLHLDPELRALLRDLDYDDAGPPAGLRARTLDAVREQPAPGQATERRRAARRRARGRRPYAVGGIAAVAAAALLALIVITGGTQDERKVQLTGSAGSMTAEIRDTQVTLKGDGKPLPAGARYELWAIEKNAADPGSPKLTSVGTFRPNADGTVDADLDLPKGTAEDVPLAVTQERDDDPAPNLPPVLSST